MHPGSSWQIRVLDLGAAKARFLQQSASDLLKLGVNEIFFLNDIQLFSNAAALSDVGEKHPLEVGRNAHVAIGILQYFNWKVAKGPVPTISLPTSAVALIRNVRSIRDQCDQISLKGDAWLFQLIKLANAVVPYLPQDALEQIWTDIETASCYKKLPDEYRQWISLVRSWGERDYEKVKRLSFELLPKQGIIAASEKNKFLLRLALVSLIKHSDDETAKNLWFRYANIQSKEILSLRLLAALAISNGYK